ncbi:MFS general substrate transporter [Suillus subalutaceus]|uniref:MFS general substrate transporter n=1 Tax=Suillus subalutaceus TaxID=48586 RepID=UPI001B864D34|nr:MFS general substrate transporter [Suillus subalutaceus]KAG1838582.1 MFS general substrate transporter [Suillus subalutaceus]
MHPLEAPSGCNSSEETEKHAHGIAVATKDVDTGAALVAGMSGDLDPDDAARVLKKIDLGILPMMCSEIQFMDKATLGSAAILGIDDNIRLGTVFYLSYLLFEYPQNLALQRFPVGRWMSINIFVWGIALACHAACTNFAGLFVARFVLGICEGSVTAGFMIVSSMFYTRSEQTSRVGYWSQIISGFISFGSLHITTTGFAPWQWLMIITGSLTLIIAVVYWFFFPDSPTNAWFLTPAERAVAIRRLKENKHFKKDQMLEALKDPKTWIFALFSALDQIPNSLTNQRQIIVTSFGFSDLQTTLLSCVDGFVEVATIWTGVTIVSRIPNSRAYVGAVYFIPALVGVFMIELLPWSNQVALLFAIWLVDIGITGFVLSLAWLTSITAGHTKRVTRNAIMLSAYCVGNALGPFMWQTQYKPRNRVPWVVIGLCYLICPLLLLVIRFMLSRENKKRDAEPVNDTFEDVYIEQITADGKRIEVKVDKEFLDLTDIQNRDFRYVL